MPVHEPQTKEGCCVREIVVCVWRGEFGAAESHKLRLVCQSLPWMLRRVKCLTARRVCAAAFVCDRWRYYGFGRIKVLVCR